METFFLKRSDSRQIQRLNRTMQYGNWIKSIIRKKIKQFKSYYVVWKLSLQKQKGNQKQRFKSYYVVWKLSDFEYIISSLDMFKSYYVVWKRILRDGRKNIRSAFKSYYVVWKPIVRNFPHGMRTNMFKSYYVVWKLLQYNTMFSPVKV